MFGLVSAELSFLYIAALQKMCKKMVYLVRKNMKLNISSHEFIFDGQSAPLKVMTAGKYSTTARTRLTGGHPLRGFVFFLD